jgi:NADPH2:quinone reductase
MSEMRAAVLREYGAVPEISTFASPRATNGDAVVDVLVAGLNPNDLQRASGVFYSGAPVLPLVPGREGVGRLDDGKRVYFDLPTAPYGSLGARTLVSSDRVFPIADGVADDIAVGLGVAGTAAWLALSWRIVLRAGETVLVLGASGTVGQVAVQAARLLGAGRVVAAARDRPSLERSRELGADDVVWLSGDDVAADFARALPAGVDVIVDPVWASPLEQALEHANTGARIVQMGEAAGPQLSLSASVVRGRQLEVVGHSIDAVPRAERIAAYERMTALAAAGELTLDTEVVALADLPDAWRRMAGSPRRKLVIAVDGAAGS